MFNMVLVFRGLGSRVGGSLSGLGFRVWGFRGLGVRAGSILGSSLQVQGLGHNVRCNSSIRGIS